MAFDGRLLAGVGVLAAAVEGGSFVRAAEALGLSASGVSRAIARLEARLGVRLFDTVCVRAESRARVVGGELALDAGVTTSSDGTVPGSGADSG